MNKIRSVLLVAGLMIGFTNCSSQNILNGYHLDNPSRVIPLPHFINEISGLTYHDGALYAVDDEHGNLYQVELREDHGIKEWKFGKVGDYEGIAFTDNRFFVLHSKGEIVEFTDQLPIEHTSIEKLNNKGRNEFESLYYDHTIQKLVMICKECSSDKKDENSIYAYDPTSKSFDKEPLYKIEKDQVEKVLGNKIERFKPSAATMEPVTSQVYILSSINRLLVTIKDNKVKDAVKLDSKHFRQPEGITFSPSGQLFISNEATGKDPATILIFDPK